MVGSELEDDRDDSCLAIDPVAPLEAVPKRLNVGAHRAGHAARTVAVAAWVAQLRDVQSVARGAHAVKGRAAAVCGVGVCEAVVGDLLVASRLGWKVGVAKEWEDEAKVAAALVWGRRGFEPAGAPQCVSKRTSEE